MNAKRPQICDEKVFPLWKITIKLGSKVIYQREKTSIFHQKSEGILHSLFAGTSIRICRYYHQNLLQVKPSDLEEKTVYFSDEVFSLSMPSVCPHLTTVNGNHKCNESTYSSKKMCPLKIKYNSTVVLVGGLPSHLLEISAPAWSTYRRPMSSRFHSCHGQQELIS